MRATEPTQDSVRGNGLNRPALAVVPPELLSPAGDWECLRAAVENGADAVYFGLESFNARMRADNFRLADLPEVVAFLHRRGVKGYLSFNTLVFANELAEAHRFLRSAIGAGVDAAIVQDVGICRLIRSLSPDFPIHASTQMTISSAGGIAFARELGCHLVVLARECSVAEIARIQEAQAVENRLPLEVFIHGALCVAYSGQCLTSEALGGRSANRGVCAQACRMPYDLVCDGAVVPLGDRRYLLSPQDLVGIEAIPDLIRARICSLKIEGRLKSSEYVANVTRIYRQAIDRLVAEMEPVALGTADPDTIQRAPAAGDVTADRQTRADETASLILDENRYEVEMAFSRGLYTGWLRGIDNQKLVHGRFGKKRGVLLGTVLAVRPQGVELDLVGPAKLGDGVVFDAGRPDLVEQGGRIYGLRRVGSGRVSGPPPVLLSFGRGAVDLQRVNVGDRVWKTSDPELERRLRGSFEGNRIRYRRLVDLEIRGRVGEPLSVTVDDRAGRRCTVNSGSVLAAAEKHPLSEQRLRDQLGRLGDTPFRLGRLEVFLEREVILPVSELNRMRRALVKRLEEQWTQPPRWTLLVPEQTEDVLSRLVTGKTRSDSNRHSGSAGNLTGPVEFADPEAEGGDKGVGDAKEDPDPRQDQVALSVLVRNLDQFRAVLRAPVPTVYCDFENPKQHVEAVALARQPTRQGNGHSPRVVLAPPRIFKPGEEWILKKVAEAGGDAILVRNPEHCLFFEGYRLIGDYSLNIANPLSGQYFRERYGLEYVTASYDLNHEQLADLLRAGEPNDYEITIHQHMPMFHMEHCLFCAFLSQGKDYRDCGRPCDQHQVQLRDRVGVSHPIKADQGCRNTVFSGVAQTGAEYVRQFTNLGARRFRLEFLDEKDEEVTRVIGYYLRLLAGEMSGKKLWQELRLFNQLGVTRGPMGQR